jgi:hypothetical protein
MPLEYYFPKDFSFTNFITAVYLLHHNHCFLPTVFAVLFSIVPTESNGDVTAASATCLLKDFSEAP